MNLIDILNRILDTKLQIKEIIKSEDYSNDISRYYVAIHNYLADYYNKGYKRGYSSKWLELTGNSVEPADKVAKWNYDSVTNNYTSYDVDVLYSIMKDVLGYRVKMRNEIGITSNYFPDYPDYLRTKMTQLDQQGYNDGVIDATNNHSTGISSIDPPTPSYDNNNVITLTTQYPGAVMYYKLSEDGVWDPYTDRIVIKDNVSMYVKQRYNGLESREAGPYNYQYNPSGYNPGDSGGHGPDDPSGDNYQNINTPIIQQMKNTIYISNLTTNATTLVRLSKGNADTLEEVAGWEDWFVYNDVFDINRHCWIEAYSVRGNVYSGHAYKHALAWSVAGDDGGTGTTDTGTVATPSITCSNNVVIISTTTPGATIHYRYGGDSGFTEGPSPVTLNLTPSSYGTVIAYATKEGMQSSGYQQAYCPYIKPDDGSGDITTNPWQQPDDRPADPVIMPLSNTVTITCPTEGATILYMLSGDSGFSVYDSPIPLTETKTCIAYATKDGKYSNTIQVLCPYVDPIIDDPDQPTPVNPKPASPTFTQESGSNIVTISTDLDGAIIKYQLGSNPTWYVYSDPITLTQSSTIAAYAYKEYDGGIKRYSDTVQYWAPWTNPNPDVDEPVVVTPVVKPSDPVISCIDNVVYITCPTEGAIIKYGIAGVPGWPTYNDEGIPITRTVTVYAVAVKDGKYSNTVMELCEYVEPVVSSNEDLHPWVDACDVPKYSYDSENHIVTLTCDTVGASIYYQINDWLDEDGWILYSSPIQLTQDSTVWAKATKSGYQDSFYQVYIFDLPEAPIVVPPPEPTIAFADIDRTVVLVSAAWGALCWKYGAGAEYTTTNTSNLYLMPTEPVTIYAKTYSSDSGLYSEEVSFWFPGIEHMYTLEAPVIEFANNRFTITNPNDTGVIYYTIDNTDPYNKVHMYNNLGGIGIPYTQNTYVRAIIDGSSEDGRLYSKETAKWVVYSDDDIDWENEYFAIKGATEIHLTGNTNQVQTLQYSYDKLNWTPFIDAVTGLDPERWVYLNIYAAYDMETGVSGGKQWDSMYFGPDDSVIMAGNPYTLVLNGRRFPDTPERVNIFSDMFKGCSQIVDAQNVYITIKNSVGYDFQRMFKDCINLVYGPKFPYLTNLGRYSMYQAFSGCSKLVRLDDIHINEVAEYSCLEAFKDCSSLINFGDFDITSQIPNSAFKSMFEGCSSLTHCWFKASGDITGFEAMMRMFYGCSSLINTATITLILEDNPIKLLSSNLYKNCYYQMFEGCSSLDKFGTIPAEMMQQFACAYMFKDCTSLIQAPVLVATTVAMSCYLSMFEGCTNLEKAPVLPATSLNGADHCYRFMFRGCEKLNYIKALFLDNIEEGPGNHPTIFTEKWVEGVAEYGTFEQNEDAAWFWTGVNAIPEKWVATGAQGRVGRIISIESVYTTVSITADNDDRIYYRINGGDWKLYDGPFEMFEKSYIEARCQNARGDFGEIYGKEIKIEIPKPIISQDGMHITISAPSGFEYDYIYFCINHFDWTHNIMPADYTETYSGPFDINARSEIVACGTRNGYKSEYSRKMCEVVIPKPTILVSNNIVTIKDNTGIDDNRILYKLNDTTDTIDGWKAYTEPFLIKQSDMVDGKITITAKSAVWSIGGYSYSELEIIDTAWDPNGANYILHVPVLRQYDNSNIIYLMYDGGVYQTWSNPDIDIMYRIGSSGTWTKYTNQFTIDADCDIYVYATDGVQPSTTAMYHFTYNDDIEPVDVPAPTYSINTISGYDYLIIQNSLPNAENYYRIGTDPAPEMFYGDNNATNWTYVRYDGRLLYPLKSGKIYLISSVTKGGVVYFSPEVSFNYVCGQDYETKLNLPTINFDPYTNTVSILTNSSGAITYYRVNNQSQHDGTQYTGPFAITEDCTIHAWNVSTEDPDKISNEYTLFCDYNLIVGISINFDENGVCSLTCTDNDAALQYSVDGGSHWTRYTEPFGVLDGWTVYARAYKDTPTTREFSNIVSRTYYDGGVITVNDPVIECRDNTVTITCSTDGATIYYKKTGDSNYSEYSSPLNITENTRVESYATLDDVESNVVALDCVFVTPFDVDDYISLEILSDGYILLRDFLWDENQDEYNVDCEYQINDDEWVQGEYRGTDGLVINVEEGDILKLRDAWCTYGSVRVGIQGTSSFNVSGNASSFRRNQPDPFGDRLPAWWLNGMFYNSKVVDASGLIICNCNSIDYEYQCADMFNSCTLLTAPPVLPANILKPYCYHRMFEGCVGITTAPALVATTLYENCYASMFKDCNNLNVVVCYATNPLVGCSGWLYGVSSTGTFTQSPLCDTWKSGVDGIPNGWTVINYVEPNFDFTQEILAQKITTTNSYYIKITTTNIFDWDNNDIVHNVYFRVKNNATNKYVRPNLTPYTFESDGQRRILMVVHNWRLELVYYMNGWINELDGNWWKLQNETSPEETDNERYFTYTPDPSLGYGFDYTFETMWTYNNRTYNKSLRIRNDYTYPKKI